MATRLPIAGVALGAALGGVAVVVAQATRQWRGWGCAAPLPAPPCVRPAFWHWSDIEPAIVLAGVCVGAAIAAGLWLLARRERQQRHRFGVD